MKARSREVKRSSAAADRAKGRRREETTNRTIGCLVQRDDAIAAEAAIMVNEVAPLIQYFIQSAVLERVHP